MLKLAVLMALVVWASSLYARPTFPSVIDLERDLKLVRGGQFPRDVQAPDGTIFHTYYVGGKELGNGEYAVIVKLSK